GEPAQQDHRHPDQHDDREASGTDPAEGVGDGCEIVGGDEPDAEAQAEEGSDQRKASQDEAPETRRPGWRRSGAFGDPGRREAGIVRHRTRSESSVSRRPRSRIRRAGTAIPTSRSDARPRLSRATRPLRPAG
ncbi:hypothetical protein EMGR_004798, partial [Emarellia grisea]